MSVIYAIINIVNDKIYVGQAFVKAKRWKNHRIALATGKHHSKYLQSAYNKYGADAFIYMILENISDNSLLVSREQYWIDVLKAANREHGYNMQPSAGSPIGYKHSQETCDKLAKLRKGKMRSPEARAAIAAGMKGRVFSEATREKMRQAQLGRKQSAETKAKRAVKMKGNQYAAGLKHSTERIETRVKFLRGIPKSPEHRAKIAAGNKGKIISEETKQKMRESALKRWHEDLTV